MFLALTMALHVLGLAAWFGGALAAAYALLLTARRRNFDKDLDRLAWELMRWALAGMALACFSGGLLGWYNVQYFTVQGWFKLKLVVVLFCGGATGLLFRESRPKDDVVKLERVRKAAWALGGGGLLLLFLSTVRPF